MSIKIMNMVWELRPEVTTTVQRLVLLALADNANDEGVCWPKQKTLAAKVGLAVRTLHDHLKALEDEGWITRRHRVQGRRTLGHQYEIVIDKLQEDRRKPATPRSGGNLPHEEWRKPATPDRRKPATPKNHQSESPGKEPTQQPRRPEGEVKPNQFPGKCAACGCVVEAGEGRLVGKSVAHRLGECAAPVKILGPQTKGRTREDWERF